VNLEQELETLEGFEAWLKEQSGVVGITCSFCECPLARYLKSCSGIDFEVAYNGIWINGEDRRRHSKLSGVFVRQVDVGRRSFFEVTAEQVMGALKAAREEVAQ
jgi:hypothetical protein